MYIFLILLFVCFSNCFGANGQFIVNYDNNEDLNMAMKYDLTIENSFFNDQNGMPDSAKYENCLKNVDFALAEKHYLQYLESVTDKFQRARVYTKLGRLNAGLVNNNVVETGNIDEVKARDYYLKAIKEAPKAIAPVLLDARAGATVIYNNSDESFVAKLDYLEYLYSLDSKNVKDNYLPSKPGDYIPPNDDIIKMVMNEVNERVDSMESGIARRAYVLGKRAADKVGNDNNLDLSYLLTVIKRFPDKKVAEKANNYLKKLSDVAADELLKDFDNEVKIESISPDNKKSDFLSNSTTCTHGHDNGIMHESITEKQDDIQENPEKTLIEDPKLRSNKIIHYFLICALVLLFGAFIFRRYSK